MAWQLKPLEQHLLNFVQLALRRLFLMRFKDVEQRRIKLFDDNIVERRILRSQNRHCPTLG